VYKTDMLILFAACFLGLAGCDERQKAEINKNIPSWLLREDLFWTEGKITVRFCDMVWAFEPRIANRDLSIGLVLPDFSNPEEFRSWFLERMKTVHIANVARNLRAQIMRRLAEVRKYETAALRMLADSIAVGYLRNVNGKIVFVSTYVKKGKGYSLSFDLKGSPRNLRLLFVWNRPPPAVCAVKSGKYLIITAYNLDGLQEVIHDLQ